MNNRLYTLPVYALLLASFTIAGCEVDTFEHPEILGDWDLATQTTSGCTDPSMDLVLTFEPCVVGDLGVECKRLNFVEETMQVGFATVSGTGSALSTFLDFTVDATTVAFGERSFAWSATPTTLTLVDQAADADGCTVEEQFAARVE